MDASLSRTFTDAARPSTSLTVVSTRRTALVIGRADNVRTGLGVAAVTLDVKAGDPAALTAEGDRGHAQTEILPISTLV